MDKKMDSTFETAVWQKGYRRYITYHWLAGNEEMEAAEALETIWGIFAGYGQELSGPASKDPDIADGLASG